MCLLGASAWAGPPVVNGSNALLTLDGTPLGTAIAARSSYPTILYDSASATYHMWVAMVDETGGGATGPDFYPLRIAGYVHATSTNGTSFTKTGTLSLAGNPFAAQIFGSAYGEPPWFYPKASVWNGSYTLFMWTINGFFGPPSLGDYNYNISVNGIGADPSLLVLTHEGPVGPIGNGIAGQTAGIYGVVNGVMYYDNNSLLGRAAITDNGPQPFPSAANTGPYRVTGSNTAVADPLTPLGFVACQFAGGNTYVHNDARVIDNGNGTLGWFFTLRNCDGSRKSQQIYYMESADGGLTWSAARGHRDRAGHDRWRDADRRLLAGGCRDGQWATRRLLQCRRRAGQRAHRWLGTSALGGPDSGQQCTRVPPHRVHASRSRHHANPFTHPARRNQGLTRARAPSAVGAIASSQRGRAL